MSYAARLAGTFHPAAWAVAGGIALTIPGGSARADDTPDTPRVHTTDASFEGLFSSDIRLTSSAVEYGQQRGRLEFASTVSIQTHDLDYNPAPFDFLGYATDRDESRLSGLLSARAALGPALSAIASMGAYAGYTDYRSTWLDEYFRQQFSALPGYAEAAPRGEHASLGARWEYLPATGFLQIDVAWRHDVIAPGYEIDFSGLRRGRPSLHTAAYRIAIEHALGSRLRTLQELRVTETSERDVRLAWQGALNVALDDRWTLRALGGFTRENPTFEAHFFGGSVECTPADGWTLAVTGRFYRDTGEIENSLFSNAAPAVDAWQAGLTVRRSWGPHTVRFSAAPYLTRYAPFGIGTAFFQNLYRSRDWALVQLAYTTEF